MVLASLMALFIAIFGIDGSQGPSTPRAALAPPARDGRPVDVRVGFLVLEFSRVDSREESFGLTAYLSLSWNDPRLAAPEGETVPRTRWFRPSEVWTPALFFPNVLDEPHWQGPEADVEVAPDGTAFWGGILSGKFAFVMHLHRFPFDRQTLPIRIGSLADVQAVRLVPESPSLGRSRWASLSDWNVGESKVSATDYRYPLDDVPYSHIAILTDIERRSTFYVWRVMVPISLLVMASWMVFWFEPTNLQPQISTSLALLLSLVTFHFGVDFSLPKVTYLSLVEKHALGGLVFVLVSAVGVAMVHRLVVTERIPLALRFQRRARWVLPLVYAASVALEFASSFVPDP